MLVNFTFKNYRSFRDEATLSMEAANIGELNGSVLRVGDKELLPVAVMYGANSSGKSNVLKALRSMKEVILNSVKLNPGDCLEADPFCLDVTSADEPTSFEIQFLLGDVRYRYGFEYNSKEILNEWLFEKKKGEREFDLYLRSGDEFKISKARFAEGIGKDSATPSNRLFVSLVAQLNGQKSMSILNWFRNIEYISGMDVKGYAGKTLEMIFDRSEETESIMKFFGQTHLGFSGLEVGINAATNKPTDSRTVHNIFNENGEVVGTRSFLTEKMESEGTKKMIEIAGPLFETIRNGRILVVDELDAKLHPFLTRKIIGLFMDKSINIKGAQLLFATHDTNLLNIEFLRRDQIWFTEKNDMDSSELYSLVEFKDETGKKVRNDRNIEKDYINGRFGAIPVMK